MAPESKSEGSKHAINRPRHHTNLREASFNASGLVLSLVQEAAAFAPFAELKEAAAVALIIFETIRAVKDNKEAYKRLGDDSAALIVAIWRSCKKSGSPKEWLSADMQEILVELTHILSNICSFVQDQLARSKTMRVIYSRADVGKIAEYRENLNAAMQKFELQSHMNIDVKLGKLSEQIRHRNEEDDIKRTLEITSLEATDREEAERIHEDKLKAVKKISALEQLKRVEIDHYADNERGHSEQLRKIEKESRDRKAELERLRAAANAEMANRLNQEEEEMAELRHKIVSGRRSTEPQSGKNKKKSTQVEDEDEEPLKTSSKVKRDSYKSSRRPYVASEVFTDDEEYFQPRRSSKARKARQKPSNNQTEDHLSDEEMSSAPKKSPKVDRKPQSPLGSPPREVDDLMAQFQGFGTHLRDSPLGSRSNSPMPMGFSPYGSPLPPSMAPYVYGYVYGGGMPGSIVNTGVGNITNTTISNVGNDNSVKKIYRAPRSRERELQG